MNEQERKLVQLIMDFNSEVRKRVNTIDGILECKSKIEGWLMGEFIGFMYSKFYTHNEFKVEKLKTISVSEMLIEFKHVVIGNGGVLREKKLKKDVDELLAHNGQKYFLILFTMNLGQQQLDNEVEAYNESSTRSTITSLINPPLFSSVSYFLGLFRIEAKNNA